MKSLKKQIAVGLVAVLAVGALTMGCNKSDTEKTEDKLKDAAEKTGDAMKDAAHATHDAATNAMGSLISTNK